MTVQAPHTAEHGVGIPQQANSSSQRALLFPLFHGHLQYSFIKTKVCFSG